MHITRSKELTVRMGDYESFKCRSEVAAGPSDLGYTDDDLAAMSQDDRDGINKQLIDLVDGVLHDQLEPDIEEALEYGQDRNSFLQRAARGRAPATTASASAKTVTKTPTKTLKRNR